MEEAFPASYLWLFTGCRATVRGAETRFPHSRDARAGWLSLPTRSSLHISQLEGFCKTGVPGQHPKVWFVLGWAWTLGLLKISQETHLQPGWRISALEAGDAGLLVVKAEEPSSVQKTPC